MNKDQIYNFLKSKGLTNAGIAGLMGNLYAESGLNPKNLQNTFNTKLKLTDEEYTKRVDNGFYKKFVKDGAGYGIAQWTYYTRKEALLNYAKAQKKSIGDLQMQLEFLYSELSTSFKSVLNTLKTTTSVQEASDVVLLQFERPAKQDEAVKSTRYQYSLSYYNTTKEDKGVMKYNDKNKPMVCMQTQNNCYKGTRPLSQVKGVLWHSTGANNPNLKRYVQPSDNAADKEEMLKILGINQYKNDWNHSDRQAGMNCWIGKLADGTITTVQTMPWDWRPWGCASGKNGSCNDGWLQFEICEDDLNNKAYFEAVYEEACQITAYLCKMFNLNPKGTVQHNGQTVPIILCHNDSYQLGLGNGHADVYHWFKKYGKTMDDVRNDVAKLVGTIENKPTPIKTESVVKTKSELQVGQIIELKENAIYTTGKIIPKWLYSKPLYVRSVNNDIVVFSTQLTGAITGAVKLDQIQLDTFKPYKIQTIRRMNIRKGPGLKEKIVAQAEGRANFTISEEKDGWGKISSNLGWIQLNYIKKL